MSMRIMLAILAGMLVAETSWLRADEMARRKDLVAAMVAEWKARRPLIKTTTCTAKVETFYPKGYLTDKYRHEFAELGHNRPLGPEDDKRYSEDSCVWAIDFVAQSVKKECQLTTPYVNPEGGTAQLELDGCLHLYNRGTYRLFRPRERRPTRAEERTVFSPDVCLYGHVAVPGLFTFTDLPLLWMAGGVNGKYPGPREMQYVENPDRFSYMYEAVWKQNKCAVLTVQEQDSGRSVRELWVGLAKSYPILLCRARDGDMVAWQIDVAYREKDGYLVPAAWDYTEYNQPWGKLFQKRTYVVQEIEINVPLAERVFDKRLEPGMLVLDVLKNEDLEVDRGGNLVPLGSVRGRGTTLIWFWVGMGIVLLLVTFRLWRYFRRPSAVS